MDKRHNNPGNPNIKDAPKPGPTTKIGKLKTSLNSLKRGEVAAQINSNSMAAKAVGFDGSKEKLQAYYNFVSFVLGEPIKTLNEIQQLEGLLATMQGGYFELVKKVEKNEPFNDKDRKDMFLIKDTLIAIHEMKYGRKQINLNTSYKDIRDAMFEE